jgi:DNA-binding transcriptional regulator/RsmH inhibitor MraZ
VNVGQIGYKTLTFLKMTDNLPQTPELLEQLYASKSRHVGFDGKNRIPIKNEEMRHAGIAQECVLIKNEGSNPYVGIWSPRNWRKYYRAVRSYAY